MKKYVAEFIGTMMLTLVACGVACTVGGTIATAFAFGLVIIAAAYSIGHISGAHINPAVSIAFVVAGKMKLNECLKYIVSQLLGALVGSLLLWFLLGSNNALGANTYGSYLSNGTEINVLRAAVIEIILTFIFITTILSVTSRKETSNIAGIVIGLTLILVHLIGIPFTGTSVNPARSLAPAIIQGGDALKDVWLFIVAPIVGGVLSGIFYKTIINDKK